TSSDLHVFGVRATPVAIDNGGMENELVLNFVQDGGNLGGVLRYSTELFDETIISGMVRHFLDVLEVVVRAPDASLSALPSAAHAKRHRLGAADSSARRVCVSATFTADALKEVLEFWSETVRMPLDITMGGYNQLFQELLDPTGIHSNHRSGDASVL